MSDDMVADADDDDSDLRSAIEAVCEFVRRFVVLSDEALLSIALWILHTHAIAAFDATPYLQVTSPQKQCGKTRLLEVLELLVARPWLTSRTSAAALVRKVAKDAPTLLLDETDAAFGGEKEYGEALRGILNAGHRRGGVASLCVGKANKVEDFPVFCAKALAGIGTLPDTIADRSLRIELQRRLPTEKVQRLRRRLVGVESDALRNRMARLARDRIDALREARPALPDTLSDRAQDAWEPLLAIADAADLGDDARKAAITLSARNAADETDVGLRCLRDVRDFFDARAPVDRVSSVELAAALRNIEDGPYGPLRGKDFDARALSKRLKPYRIRPDTITIGSDSKRAKGYMRAWFEPVWERYSRSFTDASATFHASETDIREKNPALPLGIPDLPCNGEKPYAATVSSVKCTREFTDAIREADDHFTVTRYFTDIPEPYAVDDPNSDAIGNREASEEPSEASIRIEAASDAIENGAIGEACAFHIGKVSDPCGRCGRTFVRHFVR